MSFNFSSTVLYNLQALIKFERCCLSIYRINVNDKFFDGILDAQTSRTVMQLAEDWKSKVANQLAQLGEQSTCCQAGGRGFKPNNN